MIEKTLRKLMVLSTTMFLLIGCSNTNPTPVIDDSIKYEAFNLVRLGNQDEIFFQLIAKNVGDASWKNAVADVRLLDKDGREIRKCTSTEVVSILRSPTPKGQYDMFLISCGPTTEYVSYSINLSVVKQVGSETATECMNNKIFARDLEIRDITLEPADFGFYRVHGQIENKSKLTATAGSGGAAIFDKDLAFKQFVTCFPEFKPISGMETSAFTCNFLPPIAEDEKLVWIVEGVFECNSSEIK